MAILGLRSLYFILARAMLRLRYLGKGLAIVLFYLGAKFLLTALGIQIPTMMSLTVVMSIILACILISLLSSVQSENTQSKNKG